jgi:hypothetical protein
MTSLLSFLDSKVAAKRKAQSKDRYKMEERCHAFLLLLVNSWTQEGVRAFQVESFEHFTQIHNPMS